MDYSADLFKDLNAPQREAVLSTDGPLLIIAGPGSGKTRTLVERTFHLIANQGVQPENILLGTFTEKAAKELLTRLYEKLDRTGINANLSEMYVGTIHSICLRILDQYREYTRLRSNYSVYDEFDQQYFFYLKMKEYEQYIDAINPGKRSSKWDKASMLTKWLNKLSEELVDANQLVGSKDTRIQSMGQAYILYQNHLEEENAMDFSTIQVETFKLLTSYPEVLRELQTNISHIMVDEYQDTNIVQEAILLKLCNEKENICVVGDDDQGLYRFRGATIQNILEFPRNFKRNRCKIVTMDINYRSHSDIIDFYNSWMTQLDWKDNHQKYRYDKKITPPRGKVFIENPAAIKVSTGEGEKEWYEEVYEFIRSLPVKDLNQIAFLFRSVKNEKVVRLAEYLEEKGIPVYSPRSKMFFERPEIKMMLGGMLAVFPQYRQIIQWDESVELREWKFFDECFKEFMNELRLPENKILLNWVRRVSRSHLPLMKNTDYALSGLFYQLLQFPLFSKYLSTKALGGIVDSRPARNLALFSKLLIKFEFLHNISVLTPKNYEFILSTFLNQYLRFLYQGGIDEYEDEEEYAPSGCVSFLTIHQSKGMEFPVVIVGSLNQVPRKDYSDLDKILQDNYYNKKPFEPIEKIKFFDFWRLYYTAFSRAQNLLVLTCQEKKGRGKTPSKYFEDIYQVLKSWRSSKFDLETLELKTIKDVNIKKEYSFTSHILFFEQCPRQYMFFKELGFNPVRRGSIVFGTLVHETIEDVNKSILRGEGKLLTSERVEDWFHKNYTNLVKKEHIYLAPPTRQSALRQVLQYVDHQRENNIPIQEAEVDVSLVKDEYILKGTIDLITGEKDTVEIVDFKSEKKPDLEANRQRIKQYQRQLEIYAHLVEERSGKEVSKMHLYYTGEESGNPYVTFSKKDCAIESTINEFDSIVSRIEQKDFSVETRIEKQCNECDMRFYCKEN